MNITDLYSGDTISGDWIKSEHPNGFIGTIRNVVAKSFERDGGEHQHKLVIRFHETEKEMVCNKINSQIIAGGYGSETDNWSGARIKLYFDPNVMFAGKLVGGVRVKINRNVAPQIASDIKREGLQRVAAAAAHDQAVDAFARDNGGPIPDRAPEPIPQVTDTGDGFDDDVPF